jgi:hypothetical protein
VFCCIACVLLIVLWVRSYVAVDAWSYHTKNGVFNVVPFDGQMAFFLPGTHISVDTIERTGLGTNYFCKLPSWFPLLLTIAFAAAPWLPWKSRFSLRTLLIATSLFALLLGLVVYASR